MALANRNAERPVRLPARAWPRVLLRAAKAFDRHQMTDRAATLAYYAVLSVVPILVIAAGSMALLGAGGLSARTSDAFVRIIRDRASTSATNETAEAIREIVSHALHQAQSGAPLVVLVSLVLALYGASGAFAAAGRAITEAHELPESRGFVRHRVADTATAILVIALVLLATTLFVVGGSIASSIFDGLGVGDVASGAWSILRIPVGVLSVLLAFDLVYARAPDRRSRNVRIASPGAVTALVAWAVVTAIFGTYLQLVGIGSAYGALGGVVVVLAWLWLSAGAFLLGAEVDAEAERSLARLADGGPAEGDPMVEPPPCGPGAIVGGGASAESRPPYADPRDGAGERRWPRAVPDPVDADRAEDGEAAEVPRT